MNNIKQYPTIIFTSSFLKIISFVSCICFSTTVMAGGLSDLMSSDAPPGQANISAEDAMKLMAKDMSSNNSSATLCDILTANKYDPRRVAKPVNFKDIKADKAISACTAEMINNPENARLMLNLGRAYNKKKDYAESFFWTQKAMKAGYPYAYHVLALHYSNGEGVKKNLDQEKNLLLQAVEKRVEISALRLADMELELPVQDIDFIQARKYLVKAGEAKGVASGYWAIYYRKKAERLIRENFILDWKKIIANKDAEKIKSLKYMHPTVLREYLNLLASELGHYGDYLANNTSKKNQEFYDALKSYQEKLI